MSTFFEQQDEQLRKLLAKPFVQQYLKDEDTPVLFLEPAKAAAEYRRLQAAFPKVRFHYAMKALAHPAVLRAIAAEDGYFDVATNAEVDLLVQEGIDLARAIHTHPYKKLKDIRKALALGIRIFVVDSEDEVRKFQGLSDAKVLIRLSYSNSYARVDLSSKFGVGQDEARELLQLADELGVHVAGFSYHPGSQLSNIETFLYAATQTRAFIEDLEAAGRTFEVLDIGGGLPVAHMQPELTIEHLARDLYPILEPLTARMQVLAEPGRVVAGSCMTLATGVVGVAAGSTGKWYMLDDGLYGSYSNILTEQVHPYIVSERQLSDPEEELLPGTLGGPTCDSTDVIARDLPLPLLKVGDVLLSPMMGAYTTVTASEFNGIPKTPIIVVPEQVSAPA